MPLFDASCVSCDNEKEVLLTKWVDQTCEKCGGRMIRDITAPATYEIRGDNGASQSPKKHNNKF